jgi:hypothetical protein
MNRRNRTTALVVAIASAAVFTSSAAAMAKMDNGAVGDRSEMTWVSNGNGGVELAPVERASEIPYLSHGVGITREAPALQRSAEIPYLSHGYGITREAPALESTPIFREEPDGAGLTRGEPVEVAVASGSSVEWSEVAMGFGFGLALALVGAISLLMLRQRTLRTQ